MSDIQDTNIHNDSQHQYDITYSIGKTMEHN